MTERRHRPRSGWIWRLLLVMLLLAYWLLATRNLERFPRIHYDEPIIATPGYKLFTEGVFGSDLYTGFHRQEQIYLETLPLMPVLQGASLSLLGVGVWQMRYLAVVFGLLVLSFTYTVGARIVGSRGVGVLAAWLLLTWRLTPGGDTFLGSGVTLLDVARIARYDILVPVLGLASLLLWNEALRRQKPGGQRLTASGQGSSRYYFGAGVVAGLAGFANLYGLFWVGALGAVWLVQEWPRYAVRKWDELRQPLSALVGFTAGWSLPWLSWMIVLGLNWPAATGQFVKHSGRVDLLNPRFYLQSLLREPHRYALGFRELTSYARLGFWLFLLGVPVAFLWLAYRIGYRRDRQALLLLAPALIIPLALGLFVNLKRYYYIVTVIPLLAVILAWGIIALAGELRAARKRFLWIGFGALLLILWTAQWQAGIKQWQQMASRRPEPAAFFAELRILIPDGSLTLGPPDYWFAFYDREYRSLGLLFVRSNPGNPDGVSFATALEEAGPDYLLYHPSLRNGLGVTDQFDGGSRTLDFEQFMTGHEAQLVAELVDFNGDPVTVYRLHK